MRCGIYVRVSTEEQRDNGYSIDSQLRMIKEYCERNEYSIVDVYNYAGYSDKDLMRPEMQRLIKDIKMHKLVFGQRERKEIGARTKRALEEMALEKVHPSKAPYGYIRNKETGHLEVEPIEAQAVKEIFELCKESYSSRGIARIIKDNNSYLKVGKRTSDRVYKILTNSIYLGVFEYGKYARKPQDILRGRNYCEPIIDQETWNVTRIVLEKNNTQIMESIYIYLLV